MARQVNVDGRQSRNRESRYRIIIYDASESIPLGFDSLVVVVLLLLSLSLSLPRLHVSWLHAIWCLCFTLSFRFLRNGILYLVFRPRTQVAFMALHCGGRWIEQSFWRWRRIDGTVCVFSFSFLVFQFICIFGGELPDLFIETCVKWIYNTIRYNVNSQMENESALIWFS